MKRLLHPEYEYYMPEADDLVKEFNEYLRPLVKKYINDGYSSADLRIVLFDQVDSIVLFARTARNLENVRKERENG